VLLALDRALERGPVRLRGDSLDLAGEEVLGERLGGRELDFTPGRESEPGSAFLQRRGFEQPVPALRLRRLPLPGGLAQAVELRLAAERRLKVRLLASEPDA